MKVCLFERKNKIFMVDYKLLKAIRLFYYVGFLRYQLSEGFVTTGTTISVQNVL